MPARRLSDHTGRDSCLSIMQVLHEGLADSKYRPCPLPAGHLEAGCLGWKTRRGFDGSPVRSRFRPTTSVLDG
jgi:3-hydroxyacyl-CoA dehydrogenase